MPMPGGRPIGMPGMPGFALPPGFGAPASGFFWNFAASASAQSVVYDGSVAGQLGRLRQRLVAEV